MEEKDGKLEEPERNQLGNQCGTLIIPGQQSMQQTSVAPPKIPKKKPKKQFLWRIGFTAGSNEEQPSSMAPRPESMAGHDESHRRVQEAEELYLNLTRPHCSYCYIRDVFRYRTGLVRPQVPAYLPPEPDEPRDYSLFPENNTRPPAPPN